ncbi:MAG: hypothetical protein KJ630_21595 [Proteobacteria bacterium]|nr:hypothetical protein [Pseudomonadota bacterium]
MKVKIIMTVLLLQLISLPALAFDLATKITKTGDTVKLESVGYAKLSLLREKTSLTGSIISTGKLSVKGTANIVMWARVEGKYYFSKIPALQNIKDKKGFNFKIPFNSNDKNVTEVIIEVEMLSEGNISISGLTIRNS